MPTPIAQHLRFVAWLAAVAILSPPWLTGCRSLSGGAAEELEMARSLRKRGVDPASVVVPWQLDADMRAWVHGKVPDSLATEERLERLLAALLGTDGLALQYEASTTTTAREAFASRRANCLTFTSLFVGMAREVGVPVFYLEVGDVEKFEREGNLVVESGHVTAGYGSGSLFRILEFTPVAKPNYRILHRLPDLTAVALYHSNRGAELLKAGKNQEALGWLRTATRIDPDLARGWINLGVALRRTGDAKGAEAAYRKALETDAGAVAAYQNLAALLFTAGRAGEGDELMALSGKLDIHNPFNYLALGDVALSHGRTEEARRFYRKAQRLPGATGEAEAALGQLALAAGDRGEARRWLRKAAAHAATNERVRRLAAQLDGAGGAAHPPALSQAAAPGRGASPAAGVGPAAGGASPPAAPELPQGAAVAQGAASAPAPLAQPPPEVPPPAGPGGRLLRLPVRGAERPAAVRAGGPPPVSSGGLPLPRQARADHDHQ